MINRIDNETAVEIDEFINELANDYGISMNRYSILEKIKDSDVYYDRIMDKLYKDYLTYYEEI